VDNANDVGGSGYTVQGITFGTGGISFVEAEAVLIRDVTLDTVATGISLTDCFGPRIDNVVATDGSGAGIFIEATVAGAGNGAMIHNCSMDGQGQGIVLSNVGHGTMSQCQVRNSTTHAIQLNGSDSWNITDCHMSSNLTGGWAADRLGLLVHCDCLDAICSSATWGLSWMGRNRP
jgi:hypothetical protein